MIIKINFNEFETRKDFHLWLKEECQFPDYYGCNLDALYDCLTESLDYIFEIYEQEFDGYQSSIINVIKEAGCEVKIVKGNNQ